MNTTFIDYTFAVTPSGDIIFDSELTLDQIKGKVGDEFVVTIENNRIVLKKKA